MKGDLSTGKERLAYAAEAHPLNGSRTRDRKEKTGDLANIARDRPDRYSQGTGELLRKP